MLISAGKGLCYMDMIGKRKKSESLDPLGALLCFEHFLSDISAKYINLPVEEIEGAIQKDLGRLVEFLQADRGVLYLVKDEGEVPVMDFPPRLAWPARDPVWSNVMSLMKSEPDCSEKLQYLFDRWFNGEIVRFTHLDELPEEARQLKEFYNRIGIKSYLSVPLTVAGSVLGALVVATERDYRDWPVELLPRIRLFAEVFGNALVRKKSEEKFQAALSEITVLKEQIEADYVYLKEEINTEHAFGKIVGKSKAIKEVLRKIRQVAATNATVLLLGETGTGKGLFAGTIHDASVRKHRPLIHVNCAALAPGLIESELFGHEKGAFTGAQSRRLGRFEKANGSTLFLDEIGELPLELQPKLLRALQEGEIERVGGTGTLKVDVRVIAATNRDLEKEVRAGRFRSDLWYRLNVFPVYIPPLRERAEDVPLYLNFFLDKYCREMGKRFRAVPVKTVMALQGYSWPGNIREVENLVERAVITSSDEVLQIEVPRTHSGFPNGLSEALDELEKEHITKILEASLWRISGPRGAAKRLNINPSTLRARIKKLGIKRSLRRDE